MNKTQYEDRGVSPHKPDVKRAVAGVGSNLFPGAFCWMVPDILSGDPNKALISHADGAGTKSSIAYLHYKETGDASVFRGIAQDSLAMNIDDMITVGCFGPFVLSNTIGRNAKLVDGDVIRHVVAGYNDLCGMLTGHGIDVQMCGGETADLGDLVRTIIVDSTLTALIDRKEVIDCSKVMPGHVIVGLAGSGRASYESFDNSGVGSNGFTALRHDLLSDYYKAKYPETFAPEIEAVAYTGRYKLTDTPALLRGISVGAAILSPTRIHAPVIAAIVRAQRPAISAIFHNSGGGQTKCLNFGAGVHYIKDDPIPPSPVFNLIRAETGLALRDMARTYNMGSRMEIVCAPEAANNVIAISEGFGIPAQVVGRVEAMPKGRKLSYSLNGEDVVFEE